MSYEAALTVFIIGAVPAAIFVLVKLVSMLRQDRADQLEADSPGYAVDRESGEIEFGDGQHGKRPAESGEEIRHSYEHGAGESQTDEKDEADVTLLDVFEQESDILSDYADEVSNEAYLDETEK